MGKIWPRKMAKLKAREKGTQSKMKVPLRIKEEKEGRRRVKFAGRVKSGDQEDDFEEHVACLIYTLTLNEVDATRRERGRVVSALDS